MVMVLHLFCTTFCLLRLICLYCKWGLSSQQYSVNSIIPIGNEAENGTFPQLDLQYAGTVGNRYDRSAMGALALFVRMSGAEAKE